MQLQTCSVLLLFICRFLLCTYPGEQEVVFPAFSICVHWCLTNHLASVAWTPILLLPAPPAVAVGAPAWPHSFPEPWGPSGLTRLVGELSGRRPQSWGPGLVAGRRPRAVLGPGVPGRPLPCGPLLLQSQEKAPRLPQGKVGRTRGPTSRLGDASMTHHQVFAVGFL